jgi:hypothetical protein
MSDDVLVVDQSTVTSNAPAVNVNLHPSDLTILRNLIANARRRNLQMCTPLTTEEKKKFVEDKIKMYFLDPTILISPNLDFVSEEDLIELYFHIWSSDFSEEL